MRRTAVAVGATSLVALATVPAGAVVSPNAVVSVPLNLETATVADIDAGFAAHSFTAVALTQAYLQRIQEYSYNGIKLNAIRSLNPAALQEARDADSRLSSGAAHGPLLGVPVILKDNIDAVGMPTTAGSVALANSYPDKDAPLVTSLKNAGAVILGKANLTEFANYLSSTGMPAGYSSLGGQVLNAYDTNNTPSGSSAGPGVAASIGLAPLTVGSETSGSILSPSNANEDVGIKPTVGLVSRTGVVPISSTQDTAGPITKTVADAAAELTALVSADSGDPATAGDPLIGHNFLNDLSKTALKGVRLGQVTTTRTCLTPVCDGTGGVSGTDYRDSAQIGTTSGAYPLYTAAMTALVNQGATLVPVTLRIPFIPVAPASATNPSVLQFDFKKDLNNYLSTLPAGSPMQNLQDIIDYNNAHAVDQNAIKYGQGLAIASQSVDLTDPTTVANEQAMRQRDIAQSATVINSVEAAGTATPTPGNTTCEASCNVSALVFSGAGSAGIGAKAQDPSIAIPSGFYKTGVETLPQTTYDITILGQKYTEPSLVGYGYAYEQATLLRRSPSQINPALGAQPASTLPEAPLAIGLPVIAGLAGAVVIRRRRRRDAIPAVTTA